MLGFRESLIYLSESFFPRNLEQVNENNSEDTIASPEAISYSRHEYLT